MRTPEAVEKTAIAKHLKSAGAWFCRPATFGFGASGVPDIIACAPTMTHELEGRLIGIEVKRDGKQPTPIQLKRMQEIRKAGGLSFWGTAEKVIPELIAHGIFPR